MSNKLWFKVTFSDGESLRVTAESEKEVWELWDDIVSVDSEDLA